MKYADPVRGCKWAKYPIGDVTQWHGENPDLYAKMGMKGHNGIDIVRPHGEHIYAVREGFVTKSEDHPDGYGEYLRIVSPPDNNGEAQEWTYAHLSYRDVQEGQYVKKGQFIGKMGNTGFVVSNSTGNGYWNANPYAGTHLHIGVRNRKNGRVVDYRNGYYGSYDPLPLFRPRQLLSSKIISIASATKDKVLFQFGQLLRRIDM